MAGPGVYWLSGGEYSNWELQFDRPCLQNELEKVKVQTLHSHFCSFLDAAFPTSIVEKVILTFITDRKINLDAEIYYFFRGKALRHCFETPKLSSTDTKTKCQETL